MHTRCVWAITVSVVVAGAAVAPAASAQPPGFPDINNFADVTSSYMIPAYCSRRPMGSAADSLHHRASPPIIHQPIAMVFCLGCQGCQSRMIRPVIVTSAVRRPTLQESGIIAPPATPLPPVTRSSTQVKKSPTAISRAALRPAALPRASTPPTASTGLYSSPRAPRRSDPLYG
jgi:hypothetical protein